MKEGKLSLASGGGKNGIPIPIPGLGKGGSKGNGTNGAGVKTGTLKENVAGNPRMLVKGKDGQYTADPRASKEFLKYAAMGMNQHKNMPNTKVMGTRNKNFTELQVNQLGNPDGNYVTGTPLYNQYLSGRRSVENAVNKEQIPAAYRKQVKEYFEAINPQSK